MMMSQKLFLRGMCGVDANKREAVRLPAKRVAVKRRPKEVQRTNGVHYRERRAVSVDYRNSGGDHKWRGVRKHTASATVRSICVNRRQQARRK